MRVRLPPPARGPSSLPPRCAAPRARPRHRLAGPGCARYLADFGATVIKVERPGGDATRSHAHRRSRRRRRTRCSGSSSGAARPASCSTSSRPTTATGCSPSSTAPTSLVENLRPGGLEKLGLGPDVLLARNPGLVITRVTGFGQDGPYSHRPGFATLAEAMSGFAALNGEPDGGPLLPPIALTDEVAALAAAFATLAALRSGVGQVVDVNLLESLLQLMGPLPAAYAATGYQQPRLGSGIAYTVPRGTWQCADGRWVAISTSAESVARRVLELVGLGDDPELATFAGRVAHRDPGRRAPRRVDRRPHVDRGARRLRAGRGGGRARLRHGRHRRRPAPRGTRRARRARRRRAAGPRRPPVGHARPAAPRAAAPSAPTSTCSTPTTRGRPLDAEVSPMRPWWHNPRLQSAAADALFRTWRWASRIGTLGADTSLRPSVRRHRCRVGLLRSRRARRSASGGCASATARSSDPNTSIAVGMVPDEPDFDPPEGWVVRIGDRCNIGRGSSIVGRLRIEIGDDVTTGPNIYVTDHNHRFDDPDTPIAKQWVDEAPVRIGAGCWLGANVIVLPGTTLGRNVVVGGGSVVRGEFGDHAVIAGVPAKAIR